MVVTQRCCRPLGPLGRMCSTYCSLKTFFFQILHLIPMPRLQARVHSNSDDDLSKRAEAGWFRAHHLIQRCPCCRHAYESSAFRPAASNSGKESNACDLASSQKQGARRKPRKDKRRQCSENLRPLGRMGSLPWY